MGPRSNKKGKFAPKARDLSRRLPSRTVSKSILIVCEDSKSSCDYFEKFRKELKLSSVHVEVCGKECGSAPTSVVDFAKQKKESQTSPIRDEYDNVFCVVDVDEHPPKTLKKAIQKARDNDLTLIISNPCFEYWYILHFKYTGTAYTNRPKLYQELSIHLGCEGRYDKAKCYFDKIYRHTDTAIKNAKQILSSHWQYEQDPIKCNPSTHVHRVIENIKSIAK